MLPDDKAEFLKKRMKILLVEDSRSTRKLIAGHLKEAGYSVIEASDGKEALDIFKKKKDEIALVITDWIMPEMDGYQLCQEIRKEKLDHYVYIIFLSVVEDKDKVVSSLVSGADDYLVKPFHAKELLARVQVGFRMVALEAVYKEALLDREFVLAAINHEIRNPLNAAIGNLILLKDSKLQQEQEKYVDEALTSMKFLLELLNDFLDSIKLKSGEYEIIQTELDLNLLIEYIVNHFKPLTKEGVKLICTIPRIPYTLIGDEKSLKKIFFNLVSNAVKFTEKGYIEIGVIEYRDLGDRVKFSFYVKDTGIGIPEEKQDQIFKPFCKIPNKFSGEVSGTGLGLFIARKLANLLGGDIWFESKPGEGSVFFFSVSLQKSKKKSEIKKEELLKELQNFRILVAEDLLTNRLVLKSLLEKFFGIKKIDLVETGKEAVEKAVKKNYDLIFMDVRMPQMDGLEATRLLREQGIKTPIYIVTGDVYRNTVVEAIKAGADGFIGKPVDNEKLEKVLKEVLEKKRQFSNGEKNQIQTK